MYFSNNYNNYYYPYYSLDAASIVANEESLFTDPEDDLTQIVENILNKYLKNNYLEYEKEELCQRLELIIQDQANFIYQLKIKQQMQNMTSFPYYQIQPYTNPISFLYEDNFLQFNNSKRIQNPKNKIKKTNKMEFQKIHQKQSVIIKWLTKVIRMQ